MLILISTPVVLALTTIVVSLLSPDTQTLQHLFKFVLPEALSNSIKLAICVPLLAALLGVSCAWLTAACEFPGRRFFSWALFLPMAMPAYVMAFAFIGLFEFSGSLQSLLRANNISTAWFPDMYAFGSIVLVLALVLYPYIYLMTRNAFLTQGIRSLEVGQSLGYSKFQSFFKIALPLARPWIMGSALLVMMETLADFGTVAVFNYDTLTTAVYKSWFSLFSINAALQISACLLLLVAMLLWFEKQNRKNLRYTQTGSNSLSNRRITLSKPQATVAFSWCLLVFCFAFVLPVTQLLLWASAHVQQLLSSRFWSFISDSVALALSGMIIVVIMATLLSFIARSYSHPLYKIAIRTSTLGYALPGTILAIGLYLPVSTFDKWLVSQGITIGLLQGSLVLMLLAYSVRFMAVAYTPIENHFQRISPSIDMAAKNMGVSGFSLLRKVHLPLVGSSIITAMVLVFVDIIKELPITLMTRPFGLNTLAVRVFELTSEGLWERAALPALTIVVAGLIPVILLIRRSDHA